MKRIGWLILVSALFLPLLASCGLSAQADPAAFADLARWVPGNAQQIFLLDFKPDGEAGRHWERIRAQIDANPGGQEALASLLAEFKIDEYGLEQVIVGPAVRVFQSGGSYVVAQVADDTAAEAVLRQHFAEVTWQEVEFEGQTLYHARIPYESYKRLAWTIRDGLLFYAQGPDGQTLSQLQAFLGLARKDSLEALPAWETLRDRLPRNPMGILFFNVAEQTRLSPPRPDGGMPDDVLNQRVQAIALAAVPEEDGMRVEVEGVLASGGDVPPELQALFDLPAVDPATWTGMPAGTATALVTHDASLVWPWVQDSFSLGVGSLDPVRDAVGLDLEADLLGAEGPLTGEFALAITPPLPDQAVIGGLTAGQMLFLTRDASAAQMDGLRATMETRGAIFGAEEVEGVSLQAQMGTRPSGYAISYGFDGDTLLFGSSPEVVGQALIAGREGTGLTSDPAFQAVAATLPDDASFVLYLNGERLLELIDVNASPDQAQSVEYQLLSLFEAIGLGLQFESDRLDATVYFFTSQ
jgi:hypothetical protein